MRLFVLLIVSIVLYSCHSDKDLAFQKIELKCEWFFQEEGKENQLAANIPGSIHLDLLANQKIEDPYYANNEIKQRWIEEKNWIYTTQFNIDKELLKNDNIHFIFEGIDTYSDIILNGNKILSTDNMFRSWDIDVKPFLKEKHNQLEVHFKSPILYNKEKVKSYPQKLPSGNEGEEIETKVCSFTRKAAYQFGWDWGPRFVGCGIWKPIYIQIWNDAKIENVFIQTKKIEENTASIESQVELLIEKAGNYEIELDSIIIKKYLEKGKHTINHHFNINNPQLWWSNGHGNPYLYTQKIKLIKNNQILDSKTQKYGIRTIELVNEKDAIGTAFYFKLNGKPIFMKGANYIPQDVFLTRVKDEQYESLIQSVKDAGMNMIRVWGGGVYEKDLFYELCDKNGILVWQDFMFAGSMYPNLPEFHQTIKQEIEENIKRLRNHPSIAIWCGNNEIEVAWNNWGWQKQYGYSEQDSIDLWENYKSIFHGMIPNSLQVLDNSRPYTTTSPLSNWGTAENFNHSSMHYWGVWHGREPFENFEKNVGRFMVEYGFQSFPDMSTLKKVIPKDSMFLASTMMQHRQKSYIGNGLITKHIEQYYDSPQSFEEFVKLSQETQAKGYEMAIQSHLSNQPHCMGTLFWQLNDCWPGPSWSVIDYYGNKKKAYYSVQEEFTKK